MPAIHHPTDETGLTLDEMTAELDRIERELANATADYFRASTAAQVARIERMVTSWDDPARDPRDTITPDDCNCPLCWDTGVVTDEDGFTTACPHATPWDDGSPLF